jgi:hypothetical protein
MNRREALGAVTAVALIAGYCGTGIKMEAERDPGSAREQLQKALGYTGLSYTHLRLHPEQGKYTFQYHDGDEEQVCEDGYSSKDSIHVEPEGYPVCEPEDGLQDPTILQLEQ